MYLNTNIIDKVLQNIWEIYVQKGGAFWVPIYILNTLLDFMANVSDDVNDAINKLIDALFKCEFARTTRTHRYIYIYIYQKSSPWQTLDVLIIFRHLNTPLDTFLITIRYNFTLYDSDYTYIDGCMYSQHKEIKIL